MVFQPNFVKKLRTTSDSENWRLAKKLSPKLRVFAPVIVRGEEDKGVRLFEFSKTIYLELLSIADDEDYGDFGNPFYDFMHALYLWTQDNSENALVSLRRINSTVGGLQFLEDEIKLVNDVLDGKSSPHLTYVVYESGLAPLREEKTIGPFPIPAGTDEDGNPIVITFHAALPKLSFRGEPSSMTVRVGESSFSSTSFL